jgi:probable F420-dependent oxidoreductase
VAHLGLEHLALDQVEAGAERPARILAAMGPKMFQLAGERADGAFPWMVTPDVTRDARRILGPDKWLVVAQAVAVGGDASEQQRRAKNLVQFYAALPNYRGSWLRQGFTEADLEASPRLVESLVGTGTDGAAERVRAQFDAGADHVAVQVITDGPSDDPRPQLRELAQALDL